MTFARTVALAQDRSTLRSSQATAFSIAVTLTLAWGALTFGAVYDWAYRPLVVAALAIGAWGLLAKWGNSPRVDRTVTIALLLVIAAILVQVVPLPQATIARWSPATHDYLRSHDVQYAISGAPHPLSTNPGATWRGLGLLATFALMFFGCANAFSGRGIRRVVTGIITVGGVLALVGIVQKPFYAGRIYGLWQPEMGGNPFGPFVNRNHFAGWMVMGLSLSLAYVCARIARAMRGVKPNWRDRLLWLGSPDASQIVLAATAVLLMGFALVLTMSRSGISCFTLAVALTGFAVVRRQHGSRKGIAVAYLVLLMIVAIGWAGVDVVAMRFAAADWGDLDNRAQLWRDAWTTAQRFMPFGTGLNTYDGVNFFFETYNPKGHAAQAHNDYLQLLAEGGLLVAVPVLIAIAALVRSVGARFAEKSDDTLGWWIRAGAVTGLVAIALQEIVEFSLQMPGNAALVAVVAAIAIHRAPEGSGRQRASTASRLV